VCSEFYNSSEYPRIQYSYVHFILWDSVQRIFSRKTEVTSGQNKLLSEDSELLGFWTSSKSGILNTRQHNVSESASVSVLTWGESRLQWPRGLRHELFSPAPHCDRGFESHIGMDVCMCSVCVSSVSTVSSETASRPNKRLMRPYHWISLFMSYIKSAH
jgi:hypothetical protein